MVVKVAVIAQAVGRLAAEDIVATGSVACSTQTAVRGVSFPKRGCPVFPPPVSLVMMLTTAQGGAQVELGL
jgi:hypothetical protein